jgi:riboflavin kinase/FMN adenylyltransferase
LTSLDERLEQFEALGVDLVVVVKFDLDFAAASPRKFAKQYLVDGLGVAQVIEGYDHHWGHNREGDVHALQLLGREFGFAVRTIEPLKWDGYLVNSSTIRSMLREGRAQDAAAMLRRPYRLTGIVVRGDQRGRLLGFPTANLELSSNRKLVPRNGIYLVRVLFEQRSWAGLLSIGVRPTFVKSGHRTIEVHILDFDQEIYDATLQVEILDHMRDEQRFESADALVLQMKQDEADGRKKMSQFSLNT